MQELLFVAFLLFSLSALHKLDYFGCCNFIILTKLPHLHIDPVILRKLIRHLAILANYAENEKSALEAMKTEIRQSFGSPHVCPIFFFSPSVLGFRLRDSIAVGQIKINFAFVINSVINSFREALL